MICRRWSLLRALDGEPRYRRSSERPISLAFLYTAAGVRPNFTPTTRVGVFCLISCFNSRTSWRVHDCLWFVGRFATENLHLDGIRAHLSLRYARPREDARTRTARR